METNVLPIPEMLLVHRFQYLCKFIRVSVRYFFTLLHFDSNFLKSLSFKSCDPCVLRKRSISFLYIIFLDCKKWKNSVIRVETVLVILNTHRPLILLKIKVQPLEWLTTPWKSSREVAVRYRDITCAIAEWQNFAATRYHIKVMV